MSNQNGNEQEFVHLTPENGTNAENDKQQKKMKPLTAFVQVLFDGPANGQEVKLSLKCATVAEHAAFILAKLNESQGSVVGLQLNGPVAIASVLEGNLALIDYDVPLEVDCKYTFKFKLVKVQEKGKNVPEPAEELAKRVAQLVEEKAEQQGQLEQLVKWVEELEKEKMEKRQKLLEEEEAKAKLEEEQRIASAEYARLIGVPNVANLQAYYDKEKLLQLIQHGNMSTIYIQRNQQLNDLGLLQSIVDLLATAEKPGKMVGQVTVEHGGESLAWPKREELKLRDMKRNVSITFNEACSAASQLSYSGRYLAEYELSNRGFHFQVLVHYWEESHFNKAVEKFVCRRLT